ncbi:unnamed protein product [Effrenium voratum]|nr:unnamed protein product [Effrenium voratum]
MIAWWVSILVALVGAGDVVDMHHQDLAPASSILAAAAGGFGVEAEVSHGTGDETVTVQSEQQLPVTDLEAEVQRTSRVAAYLAQDAAVLSKELQSLQMSLRGHARLDLDQEAPVSALALGASAVPAPTPSVPSPSPAPAPAPAPAKDAQKAAAPASSEGCDGQGEVPCSPVNQILTFGYRYSIAWGLLNWARSPRSGRSASMALRPSAVASPATGKTSLGSAESQELSGA